QVSGAGSDVITIDGVDTLKPVDHAIIPDRIEAGTLLVAAAITSGDVLVKDAAPEHLEALLAKLREAGCTIAAEGGGIRLKGPHRVRAVDVKTQEHPGFPTDMQAQVMALMTVAEGESRIAENIF